MTERKVVDMALARNPDAERILRDLIAEIRIATHHQEIALRDFSISIFLTAFVAIGFLVLSGPMWVFCAVILSPIVPLMFVRRHGRRVDALLQQYDKMTWRLAHGVEDDQ